ncbi:hypothetical protein PEC18_18655 [Paucibacter sp. O1-1]|nr:hypothetical protein [Paucibacter sp. O1-1]MDA3827819.1 hypothetical protein [Paucibacter sp. O1-1]
MAAVDKPADDNKPALATMSLVGSVTLMQGDVIVLGDVTADALERVLGRRNRAA